MRNRFFDIVVAASKSSRYGIGLNNTLPWNSKKEMNLFKEITVNGFNKKNSTNVNTSNIVIMGRKTFESIPQKFRPLNVTAWKLIRNICTVFTFEKIEIIFSS